MDYLLELVSRYPKLNSIKESIQETYNALVLAFTNGSKLLVAGNGGSAADSEHIVGELMKSFIRPRPLADEFINELSRLTGGTNNDIYQYLYNSLQNALPAIALTNHSALSSACINDINGTITYAQQILGWGKKGDVFLGISTSGNAKNIIYAAITAKAKGLSVIALTGNTGGKLAKIADAAIIVPETETYKIQELHLPIYHTICIMLENYFFK